MNGEYGEEEIIDEAEDQYDDTQDVQEGQSDLYGTYPTPKEKSDIYAWFWRVVRLGKLSERGEEGFTNESIRMAKVGNLNREEIGLFNTSVRDSLNLANLGEIFGHKRFGDYWQSVAMITCATSMAKKGWFMDLSISQKKVRERTKATTSFEKRRWRPFRKRTQEEPTG